MASNSTDSDPGAPEGPFPLDASTQVTEVIVAWVIMTVVASFTVCLRFYTRRYIIAVLGAEDWLILGAMVSRSQHPEWNFAYRLSSRSFPSAPVSVSSAVSAPPVLAVHDQELTRKYRNISRIGTSHLDQNAGADTAVWQGAMVLLPVLHPQPGLHQNIDPSPLHPHSCPRPDAHCQLRHSGHCHGLQHMGLHNHLHPVHTSSGSLGPNSQGMVSRFGWGTRKQRAAHHY